MNSCRERLESVEQHRKPRAIDFAARLLALENEPRKRPALQPLVQEPQSVAIEEQDLDPVTALVAEHEEVPRKRVVAEVVANDLAQPVVCLAKVHRLARHKDPYGIR